MLELSNRKRILAFTGCRSDYDLLSGVYKLLHQDRDIDFSLVVSGAHLSEDHGRTVTMIEEDGLPILARIKSIPANSAPTLRIQSAANLFKESIECVSAWKPNLILFGGDREDVIIAALLGVYLRIPTAHFFGGDHGDDGHVDHLVRHATTKLSSLHFVSTDDHRKRILALGESTKRIFKIGSPTLDKFLTEPKRDLSELFENKNIVDETYAVLIYHPMNEDGVSTEQCFENILEVLAAEKVFAFVGAPNIDAEHERLRQVISRYRQHPGFHFYDNLPRAVFINLVRKSKFLIGNSSMGLAEAPIIPLAAVNVGKRQTGRASSSNVVFVDGTTEEIRRGVARVLAPEFESNLRNSVSLYGDGRSCERAYDLLSQLDYNEYLLKTDDPLRT